PLEEPGALGVRGARLAVAECLDARFVARPPLVELFPRDGGLRERRAAAERPFAELVEVALDHRLDVDPGAAGACDHAGNPAARVRDARAGTTLCADAAVGRGIELQAELLKKRTA